MSTGRKLLFSAILVVFTIVLIEGVLQLLYFTSERVRLTLMAPWDPEIAAPVVPDERLGFRPNPLQPEHDRAGFRNPGIPGEAKVVALGDSHTYGVGVAAHEAWPRVLEEMIGAPTYSMAAGGYGPVHSRQLWDEALERSPEVVIEAFYTGNDLYDAYNLVYNEGQAQELMNTDSGTVAAIAAAEATEPIAERVSRMFYMGEVPAEDTVVELSPGFLARHSRIYGFARRVKYEVGRAAEREDIDADEQWLRAMAFAAENPKYCEVVATTSARTIATPQYRFVALDREDPRIAEGDRIIREVLLDMQERADAGGIRFAVLMIPTKELVFWPADPDSRSEDYRRLVEVETAYRDEIRQFLEASGIAVIDPLEALRAGFDPGPQPYAVSFDGHPSAAGQRIIAGAVADFLEGGR